MFIHLRGPHARENGVSNVPLHRKKVILRVSWGACGTRVRTREAGFYSRHVIYVWSSMCGLLCTSTRPTYTWKWCIKSPAASKNNLFCIFQSQCALPQYGRGEPFPLKTRKPPTVFYVCTTSYMCTAHIQPKTGYQMSRYVEKKFILHISVTVCPTPPSQPVRTR